MTIFLVCKILKPSIRYRLQRVPPVKTKAERYAYTVFRRFLINDGYDMLQWSVYSRLVNGVNQVDKHLKRLIHNLPERGSVRYLQLSEKQFANMRLLIGEKTHQEKQVTKDQMLLF